MANPSLVPVYEALFDEKFDYYDFEKRMKMQKAVYLLQDMGVPLGEYGFRWYLHGPYSQALQDDMYEEKQRAAEDMEDMSDYEEDIERLHDVVRADCRGSYSPAEWLECLGSMHYLRKRVLSAKATRDDVVQKLQEKKPHLNDAVVNAAAFERLEALFAG